MKQKEGEAEKNENLKKLRANKAKDE